MHKYRSVVSGVTGAFKRRPGAILAVCVDRRAGEAVSGTALYREGSNEGVRGSCSLAH